jgi:amino acid transporter
MAPDNEPELRKALSLFQLVSVSFLLVSAGPYGQEEAMASGGALYTFIATISVPLVFSLPLALISSEQATRLPACGGAVEWGVILGRPISYVNFYVRFARSIFDNALYPVMVSDYLAAIIPGLDRWWWRLLVTFTSVGYAIACNIFGLEAVGWVSFVLTFLIVTPFVLFVAFAVGFMTSDRVFARFPADVEGPNIGQLLATVMWQFSGFDTLGALSAETINPRRTFPIAMFLTVSIITVVYLVPTIAGVAAEPDLEQWKSGSFSSIAKELPYCSNGWLSFWISLGGVASSLSLLNAALSCNGRELYASAKLGAYPFSAFLGKMGENVRGDACPMRAILVWAVLTLPFSLFDFSWLVEWSSLLMVLGQFIQIAIFIVCRLECLRDRWAAKREESSSMPPYTAMNPVKDRDLEAEEKFMIGGGWIGVAIVVVPLFLVSGLMCVLQGWESLVVSAILVLAMYVLRLIDWGVRRLIACCTEQRSDEATAAPLGEG